MERGERSGAIRPGECLKACEIYIDAEGEWYHRGNRIFRPEILEDLCERIDLLPSGEFVLLDKSGACLLDVADVPFVVAGVDREHSHAGEDRIMLRLKHLSRAEPLDPGTLWIGEHNVLYCRIRDGRFTARFSRPAYYQVTQFVMQSSDGEFFIELGGVRYPVDVPQ